MKRALLMLVPLLTLLLLTAACGGNAAPPAQVTSSAATPHAPPASGQPAILFQEGLLSTMDDESTPGFSPDGNTVYFLKSTPAFDFWTIVESRFDGRAWTKPEVSPFSGQWADGDPFITRDGKTLFFVSMRPTPGERKKEDSDIWRMHKVGDAWGEPEHLAIVSGPENEYFPTVTDDGTLYFGSERKDGRGQTDLWRSRLVDGKYAAPENLGDVINTKEQEIEPYISPDESFLIFAAKGRAGGRGSYDLYLSRRKGSEWSPPVNLGDRVNTKAWEFGAKLSLDGKYLYFSSNRGFADRPLGRRLTMSELESKLRAPGNGMRDIYWIDWPSLEASL